MTEMSHFQTERALRGKVEAKCSVAKKNKKYSKVLECLMFCIILQQQKYIINSGTVALPFSHLQHLKSRSTLLCTLHWNATNAAEGKNGFRTKTTVSASSRGCCSVYRRPRLLSKRQIVALCQHDSAQWPSLFIWLLPWLQLERYDVWGFSMFWQRHSL